MYLDPSLSDTGLPQVAPTARSHTGPADRRVDSQGADTEDECWILDLGGLMQPARYSSVNRMLRVTWSVALSLLRVQRTVGKLGQYPTFVFGVRTLRVDTAVCGASVRPRSRGHLRQTSIAETRMDAPDFRGRSSLGLTLTFSWSAPSRQVHQKEKGEQESVDPALSLVSPCREEVGDRGIGQPSSQLTVPVCRGTLSLA